MKTTPDAPEWFLEAIHAAYEEHWIEVDGCAIHYQSWGDCDRDVPGILFVPGNGAHSHWWDFIAPSFSADYRVAAMDLSGMGDSGHREEYSTQLFAEEVMRVAADAGFGCNAILVGHSFGGSIARLAAKMCTDRVVGLVLADSAIGPARKRPGRPRPAPRTALHSSRRREKPPRSYASQEAACKRFKLRPSQPCANRYIVEYIAEHSVRKESTGWQWKLDQMMFAKITAGNRTATQDPAEMIREMKCPVSVIYGSNSRFFPSAVVANLDRILAPETIIAINDAHHHLFLDQPLQFISSLQKILRRWNL